MSLSNSVSDTSDMYTFSFASSSFGEQYKTKEKLEGYSNVKFVREIAMSNDPNKLKEVSEKLYEVHNCIFNNRDIEFSIVHDGDDNSVMSCISDMINSLPLKVDTPHFLDNKISIYILIIIEDTKYTNTFFGHNRPVATSVRCMKGVEQSNPNYIVLQLLSEV